MVHLSLERHYGLLPWEVEDSTSGPTFLERLSDMSSRARDVIAQKVRSAPSAAVRATEDLALDLPVFGYSFMSILSGLMTAEAAKAPHGEIAAAAFLACTALTSWRLAQEVFREAPRTLTQINARARE